jgi:RNA polymerase sigma-70 factor (ECF subfamily)
MTYDRRATTLATEAESSPGSSFEEVVLPHLNHASRLARWLMPNEHDAEDAVQEALLRAFRYFRSFAGGNGRAWFLQIVRNTCYGWNRRGVDTLTDPFDEERHDVSPEPDPEALLLQNDDATLVARAMRALPDRFRELLTLREFEGLSYREVAGVMGMPMGTVMSGLSRARQAFRSAVNDEWRRSNVHDSTHCATHPGISGGSRRLGAGVDASAIPAAQP